MKLVFIILAFYSISPLHDLWKWLSTPPIVIYHVKNGGNDAADGLTDATAWATLSKVNTSSFNPGDSILLKAGSSWNEQLKITSSGSVGNSIIVSRYGTGVKPEITGFRAANGTWTDSSHIWSINLIGGVAYQNTIKWDGRLRAKGRFPNNTNFSGLVTSFTKFTMNSGSSFNFTGGEVAFQNYRWIWDISKVSAMSGILAGDSVTLQDPLSYNANWGSNRFFFQNHVKCLDTLYDWAIVDSTNKKLSVYALDTPRNVFYSSLDTVISNHNNSYVTFDNITISGGNRFNFSCDTNRYIRIQYSTIKECGRNAINLNKSHQTSVYSDSIFDVHNNGLYTRWSSDTCSFTDSYWKNIGVYPGMDLSGNSASNAVFHYGLKAAFSRNKIDSIGYAGYYWFGPNHLIDSTYMTHTCLNKEDGGAIYGFNAPGFQTTGSIIRGNIIINEPTFTATAGEGSCGIYLDGNCYGVYILNNTLANFSAGALVVNGGSYDTVKNNTVFSKWNICMYTANSVALGWLEISNNIFYSQIRTAPVYFAGSYNGTLTEDYNYILRANAPDSLFRYGQDLHYYSLAAYSALSGTQSHSISSFPATLLPGADANGVLYINPTNHDSTIAFVGKKIDVTGHAYMNSFTLTPFGSKLLFEGRSDNTGIIGNLLIN